MGGDSHCANLVLLTK